MMSKRETLEILLDCAAKADGDDETSFGLLGGRAESFSSEDF